MCTPEISVSTVSILVHIITIVAVFVGARVAARLLRLFTNLRLHNVGSAPVIFEPYSSGPWLFRTLIQRFSFATPGVSLVLVVVLFLIPAELILDHGVTASDRCCPRRLHTKGLCPAVPRKPLRPTMTSISEVVSLPWDDEHVGSVPIRQGFRRLVDGTEYFGVTTKANTSLPVIVDKCRSSNYSLLPSNQTMLTLVAASELNVGIPLAFGRAVTVGNKTYGVRMSVTPSFLFGIGMPPRKLGTSGFNLTIYESIDPVNLNALMTGMNTSKRINVLRTQSALVSYTISCSSTGLGSDDIPIAVERYRYNQVESRNPAKFNFTHNGRLVPAYKPIPRASIVKAMMLLKMGDPDSCDGETWVWTKCGTIKAMHVVPMVCILSFLGMIWFVLELWAWMLKIEMRAPLNVAEWYKFGLQVGGIQDDDVQLEYCIEDPEKKTVREKKREEGKDEV